MQSLRTLLVDDHFLFRQGIASLLSAHPQVKVVSEAGNGAEGVALARELNPDLVLMDLSMPVQGGLEATRIIKQEMPHIQVVILTVSDDDDDLFAALKCGADGYLLKDLSPQQFFDRIEDIRQGGTAITGGVAAKILRELGPTPPQPEEAETASDKLTERELEVLEQLVEGATNKEIAHTLGIRENTVKIHLRHILKKLQVQNRVQAAVYAVREGLVDEMSGSDGVSA